MIFRLPVLILMCILFVPACNSGTESAGGGRKPGAGEMAELNRYLVKKDRERILNYIERKELEMHETGSGLWYMIRSEGSGELFRENDHVIMEYRCTLLDGTFCYSSEDSGPMEVIVGKSRIESGLDQGLRMLRPGGSAVLILPPFLAWGFPGDGKKIPSNAVVVFEIEKVSLRN